MIRPNVPTVTRTRRLILRLTGVLVCVCALAGCGGQYIITVGDQIARAGDAANVVIRLERYEFASFRMSVEGRPMRFQVRDLLECGAYTDELGFTGGATEEGYVGTLVPVPKEPGKYVLKVSLQDDQGDEAYAEAALYVWKKDSPVVAVDLDTLPTAADPAISDARSALARLAKTSHVVYLTQTDVADKAISRSKVSSCGYPDGPVLTWRRSYVHLARVGPLRMPRLIRNESRQVMPASHLKDLLGGLDMGLCATISAAHEFRKAGIRPVVVTRRASWAQIGAPRPGGDKDPN